MDPRVIDQLEFESRAHLLRAGGVDPKAFLLLDAHWEYLWGDRSDVDEDIRGAIGRCAEMYRYEACSGEPLRTELSEGRLGLCYCLEDEQGLHAFSVFLVIPAPNESAVNLCTLVIDNLGKDYLLNAELESMALDLGQRYDELNMMFVAEAGETAVKFGNESLVQLVKDTRVALDVAASGLFIPGKRIECLDVPGDRKDVLSTDLMDFLRYRATSWLMPGGSIVINTRIEWERYGLSSPMCSKLMIVPLHGGDVHVIGLLVALKGVSAQDFTNSDRNMLSVMAGRADKALQVNFDRLTGLENLQSFEWAITKALSKARKGELSPAILTIDLDRFNVVNDVSGRAAGDQLIVETGRLISGFAGPGDTVAHLGSDRFGMLLAACSKEQATGLGERLRQEIASMGFVWEGEGHAVSACIGVVLLEQECQDVSEAMSRVEVALNSAKEKGVNRIQLYQESDKELARRKGEGKWVGRILEGIRENRFQLYAQPIKGLQSDNQEAHYEILVRLLGGDGQIVPPGEFIPAAEHYFLMPDLDWWVVQNAIQDLGEFFHSDSEQAVSFSINLSGQTLTDQHVQRRLFRALEEAGDFTDRLVFEITESAAIQNIEEAIAFIGKVRKLGCRFSLDDFGSGLSSFAYLQKLDVDYLKIDGSFVHLVDTDDIAAAMVTSINQLAQVMGLKTIGEYVENEQIARKLGEIGVDYGQGYHYGRPCPLQRILRDLNVQRSVINA